MSDPRTVTDIQAGLAPTAEDVRYARSTERGMLIVIGLIIGACVLCGIAGFFIGYESAPRQTVVEQAAPVNVINLGEGKR